MAQDKSVGNVYNEVALDEQGNLWGRAHDQDKGFLLKKAETGIDENGNTVRFNGDGSRVIVRQGSKFDTMSPAGRFIEGAKKEVGDLGAQGNLFLQKTRQFLSPASTYNVDETGNIVGTKPEADARVNSAREAIVENENKFRGATDTTAGSLGNFAAKAIPLAAATVFPPARTLAGGALLGAGHEAMHPNANQESIIGGGATGALGSAIGAIPKVALRPFANTLNPVQQSRVNLAVDKGYELLPSQLTGNPKLALVESVLENNLLSGSRISAMRELQKRASAEAALKTIGVADQYISPEALASARAVIGQRFDDVKAIPKISFDENAIKSVDKAINEYSTVKNKDREAIKEALDWATGNNVPMSKPRLKNGKVIGYDTTGEVLVDARSQLSSKAHDLYASGDHKTGKMYEDLADIIDGQIEKSLSNSGKEAFAKTREMYRNLLSIEKSYDEKSAGNLNIEKLSNQLRLSRNKDFVEGANGKNDLVDITRIENQIKQKIPSSYTAERQQTQALMNATGNTIATAAGGGALAGSTGFTAGLGLLGSAGPAAIGALTLPKAAEIAMTSKLGRKWLSGTAKEYVPDWVLNSIRGGALSSSIAQQQQK